MTKAAASGYDSAVMTAISPSRKRPALTLNDVARRAGVSPITASRALRDATVVAPRTRERVVAAASALGYTPNLLARGLVNNRTATVGVVIVDVANPFFAPMVSAIEAVAARHGHLVVIGESGRDEEREREYVARFRQMRVAGIIVTPAWRHADHLAAARSGGTPVVVMSRRWLSGDYVTADNSAGGALAARHCLTRGYRRIAMITPGHPLDTSFQDRIHSFRRVLHTAGVSILRQWDIRTKTTGLEDGLDAADRILACSERPQVVFATTDRTAMGLIAGFLDRGIRVPADIAVVGYDDIPFAACNRVPLTTVRIPLRQVGELAAELLFERMERAGTRGRRQIRLVPELVIRASCP